MDFLLNGSMICPIESGKQMDRRPRRNHLPEFKAKVALEAVEGEYAMAKLAKRHSAHPNQATLSAAAAISESTSLYTTI